MNSYVKEYLHRGLIFSGLGPVVLGIVYMILNSTGTPVVLSALDVFKAILTTYIIAFVQAGASVFPQIESWSKFKAAFFQGFTIYLVYLVGYLINSWIPFEPLVIIIFTSVFAAVFVSLWIIIFTISKKAAKQMNERLSEINK